MRKKKITPPNQTRFCQETDYAFSILEVVAKKPPPHRPLCQMPQKLSRCLARVWERQGWKHNGVSVTLLWDFLLTVCSNTSWGSKSSLTNAVLWVCPRVSRVEETQRSPSAENHSTKMLNKPCDKQK